MTIFDQPEIMTPTDFQYEITITNATKAATTRSGTRGAGRGDR